VNDNLSPSHPTPPLPERRSFLSWLCVGLGGLFGVILGFPAIAYLIDPRNRKVPSGAFKPVARLGQLQTNVPFQAVLRDIRRDAWTIHPDDVVGRVWLIRRPDGAVEAYTTICPHLGCSINYEDKREEFICPCHGGTWNLKCKLVEKPGNPAPRNMDQLECRVEGDEILVKYENFIQGLPEKQPKT
jgi:menaquinol-cytochrome c reductase iron-sulfur subunit